MSRFLWNLQGLDGKTVSISLKSEAGESTNIMETNETFIGDAPFKELSDVGRYSLILKSDEKVLWEGQLDQELLLGANYQVLFQYNADQNDKKLTQLLIHQITSENEIHIFWLLPQFVIMTAGEIMFSITSLQFSFTQVET